jgi:hypothetical protein
MFQQAKVTLYDFFGYLLPGLVVLAAIGLLFWAIHYPSEPVTLSVPGAEAWVIILTVGYIAGHMAQAFSNLLLRLLEAPFRWLRAWKRLEKWLWFQKRCYFCSNEHVLLTQDALECLPAAMLDAAKAKAATLSGLPSDSITGEWLFRVCDEAVVQRGSMGDREIFVYREGFYRGLWAALLLLFIAIIVRMAVPGATVHLASGDKGVGTGVFWFFLVAVGVCIYFSFQRFRRFGRYRITQALLAFLVMPEEKKKEKEKKGDEK